MLSGTRGFGLNSYNNNFSFSQKRGFGSTASGYGFGGGIFGNGLGLGSGIGGALGGGLGSMGTLSKLGPNLGLSNNFSSLSRGLVQRPIIQPFTGNANDISNIYNALGVAQRSGIQRASILNASPLRPLSAFNNDRYNQLRVQNDSWILPVFFESQRASYGGLGRNTNYMQIIMPSFLTLDELVANLQQYCPNMFAIDVLLHGRQQQLIPLQEFAANNFNIAEELCTYEAICLHVWED